MWLLIKALTSAGIIVAVSEISPRFPRWGAVLLSLPIVSLLAFVWTWIDQANLSTISRLARETLVLVPLGLPFFIPLAFSERLHLGFWSALALGLGITTVTLGVWLRYVPANW
jgi:hypothetical protein